MKVLVTGGAGFIGSHLVAALVGAGHDVRVLDDLSSGRRANLSGTAVPLTVGDVADPGAAAAAVAGCDLVYHLAAMVSAPRSLVEPAINHQSNVTGMFNVLEAARDHGARRVVYASSAAVYGNLPGLPKREYDALAPLTPYAAAKRMNELYAATFSAAYGLETVGLRFMNVFGPRQDPGSPYSGVLSLFCRAAMSGQTCTIYGDGEQTRDFVFVSDVVSALLQAGRVSLPVDERAPVINVGRGEETSLNTIVSLLADLTGEPVTTAYAADRAGDIRRSVADIGLARTLLGYKPSVTVREGLKRTLAWFQEQ